MNVVTEMKMPLSEKEYKRWVSGEDCTIAATQAIRELLEQSMDEALSERLEQVVKKHGMGVDPSKLIAGDP